MSGITNIQVEFNFKVDLDDFVHHSPDCDGKVGVFTQTNVPYSFDGLGMINVPFMFFVGCEKCKSAHVPEPALHAIERLITGVLITSRKSLSKRQLKFLRLSFDKVQHELAEQLEITKATYSKYENEKNPENVLDKKSIFVLKVYYLRLMGKSDAEVGQIIKKIYEIEDGYETLDQLETVLSKENIENELRRA